MPVTVITNMPLYQAMVLRSALELYDKHKIMANRSYTPTNMLRVAGEITGFKFTRGKYGHAIGALSDWIDAQVADGQTLQSEIPFPDQEKKKCG